MYSGGGSAGGCAPQRRSGGSAPQRRNYVRERERESIPNDNYIFICCYHPPSIHTYGQILRRPPAQTTQTGHPITAVRIDRRSTRSEE